MPKEPVYNCNGQNLHVIPTLQVFYKRNICNQDIQLYATESRCHSIVVAFKIGAGWCSWVFDRKELFLVPISCHMSTSLSGE